MTQRVWPMGIGTIIETIPTITRSPKPVIYTHYLNNAGNGMKAAKVDSSSDQGGSEEVLVEELIDTAKEKGITVIEEPRTGQFSKMFRLKVKLAP